MLTGKNNLISQIQLGLHVTVNDSFRVKWNNMSAISQRFVAIGVEIYSMLLGIVSTLKFIILNCKSRVIEIRLMPL
jgi:hypothetical protein